MAVSNEKSGYVMNIQRYSLHDGPGIRTVVFLKGCPLRCVWCCNPESWNSYPEISYDSKKCIGLEQCSFCIKICKTKAIKEAGAKVHIDRERCNNCTNCAEACPSKAISIYGELMTVQQLMKIIEKDSVFYTQSGGGITISGGEALMQMEFTREVLKEAKKRRIHTAVETCGHAKWESIEAILGFIDCIYYDVKCMDNQKHKKFTGAYNGLILENLKKLYQYYDGNKITVRTPVIPGFNDDEKDISDICSFLKEIGSNRHELLPYHRFGKSKYEALGKEYPMGELELSKQKFESLEKIIKNYNGGILV